MARRRGPRAARALTQPAAPPEEAEETAGAGAGASAGKEEKEGNEEKEGKEEAPKPQVVRDAERNRTLLGEGPFLVAHMEVAVLESRRGRLRLASALMEEGKGILEGLDGAHPRVHAAYYGGRAEYFKVRWRAPGNGGGEGVVVGDVVEGASHRRGCRVSLVFCLPI